MSPPKIQRKYRNFNFRLEGVCRHQKFGGSIKILFSNRRKYVATKNRLKYQNFNFRKEEVCRNQKIGGSMPHSGKTEGVCAFKNQRKYPKFDFQQEEVCHMQKFGGSFPTMISLRRKYVETKNSEEVSRF